MQNSTNPFVRDSLNDQGQEPNNGALNVSPDIIPRQESVSPVFVQQNFGAATYDEDRGQQIEAGEINYVYVRVKNPAEKPFAVDATLYWARPSCLQFPTRWNEIGTQKINFIEKNILAAAEPYNWMPEQLPDVGHYCLIVVLSGEGLPSLPESFPTIGDWWQFCRDHNTVAQRNIDIVDVKEDPIEKLLDIVNPDNQRQLYQFEAICNVPKGSVVSLFSNSIGISPTIEVKNREITGTNNEQTLYPHQCLLPANFEGSLQLTYVPNLAAEPGDYSIVVKQYLIQNQERMHVGSYTFEYKS
ncbi:hypothetical protein [uncultured Kordia sp.]|uniref:hypothetical protein n=1 Tax=uncultured Kordia sp. TaxID=507699 RepID=UPI002613FE82|nr:hypothetical protein [uncultured Kordia sp.]